MICPQIYHKFNLMKTKTNLPEPTFEEKPSRLKNTLRLISGVFYLTKKVFFL
ncbi:hypothetical protein SAMN05444148_0931 [Winogradskyella jejuensis]|uniref:Uncharacterized protein n=1 Tax=Winogradskyella jejuensis TaxID=1089305 RepID=A0A1M5MLS6_9FLAO|nr:hypothetical protein SAMN05444148_0931 [Winogradskyella jejuensis]